MSRQLIEAQRYEIYLGLKRKWRKSRIAAEIGVSCSTVCREVARNSNADGEYLWKQAQAMADARRHVLDGNHRKPPELWWRVEQMILDEDWSPAQIAGVLRREGVRICKQTIYNHVHADPTGKLARHMPHQLKYTRRAKTPRPTKATNIKNRVSIHERPKEADGTRFGDWEMDLIVDKDQNGILTMVERSTNFLLMAKLRHGKQAMPVAKAAWRLLLPYKGGQLHTITTDNGSEFAAHEWLTRQLGAQVYFTDSYASWQKGAVENANKLVRQYIPKGMDISTVSDQRIASIKAKINRRPREKLNFNTPKDEFFKHYS